jgi:CDP-glucose 4,6-dehydratase
MYFNGIFNRKKVLVTGHTGFKGTWLITWLELLGAEVYGVSLDPITYPSHFDLIKSEINIKNYKINICSSESLESKILEISPDFVFHLAAQAIVRTSYDNPYETWNTNVIGTLNVLESLRKLDKLCTAVIITSDKCYDNVEWIWGYRENDVLGGPDPYSASKGAAELVFKSYFKSYFSKSTSNIRIASARAGNVIGGGDWAQSRIVPDCVRAWSENSTVQLRNPSATRPWQHVLEPLSGYLALAENLSKDEKLNGESFNFGPNSENNHSVKDLVIEMSKYWDLVNWLDVSDLSNGPYESGLLKLNCDKALAKLKWSAALNFQDTVKMTTVWYKNHFLNNKSTIVNTREQINEYIQNANLKGIEWAKLN